jgi:protein-tyrosine-phosphatase
MDQVPDLLRRVTMYAALGEPARLAIVDDLAASDRSPKELGERHGLTTNLLAHHLAVLEAAGLVTRLVSAGDRRRRYVRLIAQPSFAVGPSAGLCLGQWFDHRARHVPGPVIFLCTHNSARSQLAAALWTARTGNAALSAGTHPAPRVHRGAVAAARRAGLELRDAVPRLVDTISDEMQVITVCDRVHEELQAEPTWWHWSIPDPVDVGTRAAFDAVVDELDRRIHTIVSSLPPPDRGRP